MANRKRDGQPAGLNLNVLQTPLELNAESAGKRILVLPLGEITGRDGRMWDLSREDAAALVALINKDGLDIVLDRDHCSIWGETRAAGWLSVWKVEDDGVTALLELNEDAKADVEGRYYRYISPAFQADKTRILAMHSVALTNTPNLAELPALNQQSQEEEMSKDQNGGEVTALAKQLAEAQAENKELNKRLTDLNAELNKVKTDMAEMEKNHLENTVTSMVEAAIAGNKLRPSQRESALKMGMADANSLKAFLDGLEANDNGTKDLTRPQAPAPGAEQNGTAGGASLTANEMEVCRSLGVTPERYAQRKAEMEGRA